MDGSRFDNLAKSLAQGTNRRRVLKGLAGAVAGALVGSRVADTEAACPPGSITAAGGRCICKNTGRPPVDGSCTSGGGSGGGGTGCGAGQMLCGTACVDASSDPNNCGGCGNVCGVTNHATSSVCLASQCWVASCEPGWADCNRTGYDGCETQLGTNANCAACGDACTGYTTCGGGGTPGVCGCTRQTCQPGQCGPVPDGCGGTLDCGPCCTPQTCESLGAGCGTYDDGCGHPLTCTTCPAGQTCTAAGCKTNNGGACAGNGDCASGVCAAGICCDQACDGECRSCATGTCQDRSGACGPDTLSPSCHGTCQAGQCVVPPDGSICAPPVCSGINEVTTSTCGGLQGACVAVPQDCGLFLCRDGACLTTCQTSADCLDMAFCLDGVCYGDAPDGTTCNSNDWCLSGFCRDGICSSGGGGALGSPCLYGPDCASGHCAHGICCNQDCNGTCQSCEGGVCRLIPPGDGNPDCGGINSVICGGACDGIHPDCVFPGDETLCGALECPPDNKAVTFTCDGAGTCVRHTVQCTDDQYCHDAVCIDYVDNGGSCQTDSECSSGHCVSGTCCQQACPDLPSDLPAVHSGVGHGVCKADGVTCGVQCAYGPYQCGDTCCNFEYYTCCSSLDGQSHTCCGAGAQCINGQCTEFCAERGEYCDYPDEKYHELGSCCPHQGLLCSNDLSADGNRCHSDLGYPCPAFEFDSPAGCAPSLDQVWCAPIGSPGEGTCGGTGAKCTTGTWGCASGRCCGDGDGAVCC